MELHAWSITCCQLSLRRSCLHPLGIHSHTRLQHSPTPLIPRHPTPREMRFTLSLEEGEAGKAESLRAGGGRTFAPRRPQSERRGVPGSAQSLRESCLSSHRQRRVLPARFAGKTQRGRGEGRQPGKGVGHHRGSISPATSQEWRRRRQLGAGEGDPGMHHLHIVLRNLSLCNTSGSPPARRRAYLKGVVKVRVGEGVAVKIRHGGRGRRQGRSGELCGAPGGGDSDCSRAPRRMPALPPPMSAQADPLRVPPAEARIGRPGTPSKMAAPEVTYTAATTAPWRGNGTGVEGELVAGDGEAGERTGGHGHLWGCSPGCL